MKKKTVLLTGVAMASAVAASAATATVNSPNPKTITTTAQAQEQEGVVIEVDGDKAKIMDAITGNHVLCMLPEKNCVVIGEKIMYVIEEGAEVGIVVATMSGDRGKGGFYHS